jgi:flagellar basal-body rod protein FlgC
MLENISAREIAVSGLRAQRTRMNIIANNIANAGTTRTPEGGAFRRQMVVLRGESIRSAGPTETPGVRVTRVQQDVSPLRSVHQPGHPDADGDGYVAYPNVDVAVEMVDMIAAQRAYEANLAVLSTNTQMADRALGLLEV